MQAAGPLLGVFEMMAGTQSRWSPRLLAGRGSGILLLLALLFAPLSWGSAGKVLMAVGDTSRIDSGGSRAALQTGDLVNSGDTLLTGADSRLQWRTNDGGLFALRPNSEFKVDEYQYDAASKKGRSFFSLAKGGFRTLSGTIGKHSHADYKLTTAVVTMGIRGTSYVVQLCLAGSVVAVCNGVAPGLYMGTIVGAVVLGNNAGSLQVGAGQFGYVRSLSSPPQLLPAAPGMLFDTTMPTGRGGSKRRVVTAGGGVGPGAEMLPAAMLPKVAFGPDGTVDLTDGSFPDVSDGGVLEPVEPPLPAPPPLPPPPPPIEPPTEPPIDPPVDPPVDPPIDPDRAGLEFSSFSTGPLGTQQTYNELVYAAVADVDLVGGTPLFGSDFFDPNAPGTSRIDVGEDPNTGIFWGRYINGTFNPLDVTGTKGAAAATDPFEGRSVHYVAGALADSVQLPITGTANYGLVGGTTPTDNYGGTGTLNSASLNANFTNRTVAVSLDVSIASRSWVVDSANVELDADAPAFFGSVSVDVDGNSTQPGGSGLVSGFFAGPSSGANGAPAGVGLSYSLDDGGPSGDNQVVSGAAALGLQ